MTSLVACVCSTMACVGSLPPAHQEMAASRIYPALTPHAPQDVNPFAGARLYASQQPAVWLDSIARVSSVSRHLDEAARQQAQSGEPVVPVFVIYDLPIRDCFAAAPSGELGADDEGRYQHEFIDAIAAQFRAHGSQRIVVIVEPGSLANLAANAGDEKCVDASSPYRRGVAYAVATLSLPHVFVYLDAAYGRWLGCKSNVAKNVTKMVEIYKTVLATAGGADRIRGFAVNATAEDQASYIENLARELATAGIRDKGFVVDGGHESPRVARAPTLDAYLWLEAPRTAGAFRNHVQCTSNQGDERT